MWKRRGKPEARAYELSDQLRVLEAIAGHGSDINFGAPTRCPGCGDYGLVEDTSGGLQHNRCVRCACEWAFGAHALQLFRFAQAPVHSTTSRVVGQGTLVDGLSVGAMARVTCERFVGFSEALHSQT